MEIKKIIKTIIEWIIYIAIFLIIVWGTPWALTKILKTEYPIASITSSSMWPALKQSDIVFIKGVSGQAEISVGDIVVYRNERGFTIHRVTELRENELVTRGDANNVSDSPIKYDQVIGKAVKINNWVIRVPYLGKLSGMFGGGERNG